MEKAFTLYETAVGGTESCRRLAEAFYARVARDPVLKPLFPGKTMTCAIEAFAAFLAQFLGGPADDAQRRWYLSLRESHARFAIGPRERDAWMRNMIAALDETPLDETSRGALRRLFERSSAYIINANIEEPRAGDTLDAELSRRWDAQRLIDDVVDAIWRRDADRAIALTETPALAAHLEQNPAVCAALLARMIRSRRPALIAYVRDRIAHAPNLVHERYSGRTLLHEACAAGDVDLVEQMLHLGADSNGGEHHPLYSVGNECSTPGGGRVVAALVRAGAQVNAGEGAKHCTALHMAARRGNVEVAEALLACGADIDPRDTLGDTPLRRAVNLEKTAVAALLMSHGADPQSRGSKGLTPREAARSRAMRDILSAR